MAVVGLVYHPDGPGSRTDSQQQVEVDQQLALNPAANPPPYEPNCEAPRNREEADLCAQREMAEAATQLTGKTNTQLLLILAEIVVLIAAFAAAVRAAIAAREAANHGSRQADAAIEANKINTAALNAAHRPWIEIDISVSSFVVTPNEITINAEIVMRNVGNAPAMRAFVHPKLVALADQNSFASEIERMASTATVPTRTQFGYTIFPDREFRQNHSISANRSELPAGRDFIVPHLIGLADYQSPTDQAFHKTGFILEVTRRGRMAIRLAEGTYGTGDLLATISFLSASVD